MFSVFSAASKVQTERVANYAFELVTLVYKNHFQLVVRYGAFSDLTSCITEFCKVSKFQKISLQAIEMTRGLVPMMLKSPECHLPTLDTAEDGTIKGLGITTSTLPEDSPKLGGNGPSTVSKLLLEKSKEEPMIKYWLPVLNSFYEIIMSGEDLEVRRL